MRATSAGGQRRHPGRRAPLSQSSRTVLAWRAWFGIVLDGDYAYLSAHGPGRVLRVPVSGGEEQVLYGNLKAPYGLVVVGADVYWIDPTSSSQGFTELFKAPKSGGGAPKAIYTGISGREPIVDGIGLASEGQALYAADMVNGRVHRLAFDGSGLKQLGPERYSGYFASEHYNSIVAGKNLVYVCDSGKNGVILPQVVSIPASGGSFTTLSSGPPFSRPMGIALAGDALYVTDPGTSSIWRLAIGGGKPTGLVADPRFDGIGGIAHADNALYVTHSKGIIYKVDISFLSDAP